MKRHLKLLASGLLTWGAFWVAGLPDYYQQYPAWLLALGTALLVPPTAWVGWKLIVGTKAEHRFSRAFWLAFYFTVPFAVADTLYCGVYLGHHEAYLVKYWYLTVFYVIPWVLYLPMGLSRRPSP